MSAVPEVGTPQTYSLPPAVEAAVTKSMNSVTTDGGGEHTLGPVPTYKVLVNGVPLKALIDTGSPATVISLDCLVDVLAQEYETAEQWRLAMQKQLEPPTMLLKSYCGGKLYLVAQVKLQIATVSGQRVEAIVQVQEDAPVDLLLGTDLQPLLGFSLTVNVPGDNSCDLLKGSEPEETQANAVAGSEKEEAHEDKAPPTRSTLCKDAPPFTPESVILPTPPPGLMVKLIQASRIPARRQKLIKVEIEEGEGDSLFMFAPNQVELQQQGLVMVYSVEDVEGGHCVKLLIENHSYEPRHLKEGMKLGEAQPIQLLLKETKTGGTIEPEPTLPPTSDDPYVAALKSMSAQLRQKKLLELLNLKDVQLEPNHMAQLEAFRADVFAHRAWFH